MTLAFRRIAKFFSRSILSVRDYGASGASLCSGNATLYSGLQRDGTLKFGAFDASITDEHFFTESSNDRGVSVNLKSVRVRYPSMSGVGCRAMRQSVGLRYGSELNFHDATKPAYLTNVVHDAVREAFEKVDGEKVGELARIRPAEVIVVAGERGKPIEKAVVWSAPLDEQPEPAQGVLTDANGTAWLVLRHAGRYRFSCPRIEASRVAEVELPEFDGEADWGFLQWVELGDAKSDALRRRLMQPAQEEIESRVEKPNNRSAPSELPAPRLGELAPDEKGFITDWLVIGPMPNPGDREHGFEGFKTDWFADQGGEANIEPKLGDALKARFPDTDFSLPGEVSLKWRDLHDGARVRLDALTAPSVGMDSEPPLFAVAYAFCSIVSTTDQDIGLAIGSDDGHAVWLNHELIGADPTRGGASPDESRYKARLHKGANALLVKVDQSFGGWCFYLRFLRDDKPLVQLKVVLK